MNNMVQGIFAGMTSYQNQSIIDLEDDILQWIEQTEVIQSYFNDKINNNNDLFSSLPFDLKCLYGEMNRTTNTFLHDFKFIYENISKGNIRDTEINLMVNIALLSSQYNTTYAQLKKQIHSDIRKNDLLKEYAENLYCKGRDYYANLLDVANAAIRLKDYKRDGGINVTNNFTAKGTNIQQGIQSHMTMNNGVINNIDEVNKLIDDLSILINQELTKNEEREETKELIETIQEEVQKETPKKFTIKNSLERIKNITSTSSDISSIIANLVTLLELY